MHRTRSTAETLDTAFRSPAMKTLYITAGKTLYKVRTEIPGLAQ